MPQAAGELDKRLVLQNPPPRGGRGRSDLTAAWVDVATVWAGIETLGGRALEAARQSYDSAQLRVTIRKRAGVRHGMRFWYPAKSEALYIGHVEDPDRANEILVCFCSTIAPSASPAEA